MLRNRRGAGTFASGVITLGAGALLGSALSTGVAAITPADANVRAFRYADGAPPGFSGGFKESACDACHFESEINAKPGQLVVQGVPERFAAGERYPLTIALSRPGMAIGGFQLTARFEDGRQAGTLAAAEGETERVAIEAPGGVQYVNQRRRGATPATPGTTEWTLIWTAPAGGNVLFHVAANAADNDESVRGDFVYTTVVQSRPQ